MTLRYLKTCYRIEVTGVVQGVGFRPFVYRLAQELGISGYVLNHERGVTIEVECSEGLLRGFLEELVARAPQAAHIDSIRHEEVAFRGHLGFQIRKSSARTADSTGAPRDAGVSPDLALCCECRNEIHDPGDRRYAYPFTNCTNCGPRFTIIREIPYDRAATTMNGFQMCADCEGEYGNPENRRFHAQPNACPMCGPAIELLDNSGSPVKLAVPFHRKKPVLDCAVAFLRQGKILALKGIGGFHLACDASNAVAVETLRIRKARESKPFAVMFPNVDAARNYITLSEEEASILSSAAAPILLARRLPESHGFAGQVCPGLAEQVAPGQPRLGVFLPYSPLHELLLSGFGKPLVMTSGNKSDEPIAHRNETAVSALGDLADYLLVHDRPIEIRCDDSVVQEFRGKPFFFRRSRGYAPLGVRTSEPFASDILAVGAGLKNTVCVAKEGRRDAVLSQHLGDLNSAECEEFFEKSIDHLSGLLGLSAKCIAHDLHPDLTSSKWAARKVGDFPGGAVPVQHHHAHIVSCLEDGTGRVIQGPVIGLALDGTGVGTDGTIWGGEILLADRRDFLRVGSLKPIRLPGGEFAIRQPWRTALAFLRESGIPEPAQDELLRSVPADHLSLVRQALSKNLNCFTTSSCGRLFDAVSAILGLCREARFEGEPAILLEAALENASSSTARFYEFPVRLSDGHVELDWRPMIGQLVSDVQGKVPGGEISRRFHVGLVSGFLQAIEGISKKYSIRSIALSGGCFLNTFLRERFTAELEARGFQVLFPTEVPCNDGGIAFGQVIVANQVIKGAQSCVWQYR